MLTTRRTGASCPIALLDVVVERHALVMGSRVAYEHSETVAEVAIRHFQIAAERIDELHLPRRAALRLKNRRGGDQDAQALRA